MRQRHAQRRGVEYRAGQSLPGDKSPDRIRNTGLQDPSLALGQPVLVEAQEGQSVTSEEPFTRFTGNVALQPPSPAEPTSDLL